MFWGSIDSSCDKLLNAEYYVLYLKKFILFKKYSFQEEVPIVGIVWCN